MRGEFIYQCHDMIILSKIYFLDSSFFLPNHQFGFEELYSEKFIHLQQITETKTLHPGTAPRILFIWVINLKT